jgi:rhamnose utilization protein RhaD (predicted bifunctional aldolase and dehydrogenase)
MQTIKRIVNPIEFCRVIDDLDNIFKEDKDLNNSLLKYDSESIKRNFSNNKLLNWDLFVWANFNGESYDSMICFLNEKNVFFNEQIFSQYLWLSKNKKTGYKLFSTAIKFAKEKDFKYVKCKTCTDNTQEEKVKSFYEKIGLIKESETYICEL